ncbi:ROK family protein [uncultured Paludibaculum sp.]|uniref:ROK family protein n=1 Tax=uncultured Paludibaculum sp. TaxID=1765020 RepID=UPI002AAAC325|nr:ROK family protein [uncultured Paludibaculum sp.]
MKYVNTQKERDAGVILNVVRNFGPLSRVEIHRLTGLRTSAISQLTKELLSERRLEVAGLSDNPTGRKQVLLRVNQEQGFLLGIEFDSETVVAGVMDLAPHIRGLVREPTRLDGGESALIDQLKRCARKALAEAGVSARSLRGIGIADVGLVNRSQGISVLSSQLDFWRNVPLVNIFEDAFHVPAFVENATRCRGNAERLLGAGESNDDMIYIEYGAGIGSALFSGGRVIEGRRTSAGEFGHTRVSMANVACKCGSFGCLEAVAGSPALAHRFREIIREGGSSLALSRTGGDPLRVTGWDVLEAARAGDKVCLSISEEMCRYLAIGLANLVNLLDPARIVLDQRLEICGAGFLDQIQRTVRLQALSHLTEDLVICFGSLGDTAGVLGAGLLSLEELFTIPELKTPQHLREGASGRMKLTADH